MRYTWDFFVILSALVWILALVLRGYVSPSFAASVLVAIVFFRALGRGLGGNIGRIVRFLFTVGLPLASLSTFLVIFGGGSFGDILAILSEIAVLCLVLAGLYVIFFGIFSSGRRK